MYWLQRLNRIVSAVYMHTGYKKGRGAGGGGPTVLVQLNVTMRVDHARTLCVWQKEE